MGCLLLHCITFTVQSSLQDCCTQQVLGGGFANPTDLQRINAFLRRGIKCGLSSPETHNFEELCKAADIKLFKTILTNNNHVLHKLLPPQCNAFNCYNLRKLTHNRQLPDRHNRLTNCNFLNRVLYNDVYLPSN